jgi:hypothetical protein
VGQAAAQRFEGHWLIGPPGLIPDVALRAAVVAMHAVLDDFEEEGWRSAACIPSCVIFQT